MLNALWRTQNTFHTNMEEENFFLWKVQGLELTLAFEICMIYYSLNREVAHPGNCCKQTQKNKTRPLVFQKCQIVQCGGGGLGLGERRKAPGGVLGENAMASEY